jgi:hypothetical protein
MPVPAAVPLQAAGYPPDEAASRERLQYRLEHAGGQFLAAVEPAAEGLTILGFVCGTLSSAECLTHESMGTHEPDGGAPRLGAAGASSCRQGSS